MANRVTHFPIQYLDLNGNPATFGKLYFYKAGTDTLIDTFTTIEGDISNSNPIILDGSGFPPESIYVDELFYKIRLEDSNDVLIREEDNLTSSSTVNYLKVDTRTDLRNLDQTLYEDDIVCIPGEYNEDGSLNRLYYWDDDNTSSDNDDTVIQPSTLPTEGRWVTFVGLLISTGDIADGSVTYVKLDSNLQSEIDQISTNTTNIVSLQDAYITNGDFNGVRYTSTITQINRYKYARMVNLDATKTITKLNFQSDLYLDGFQIRFYVFNSAGTRIGRAVHNTDNSAPGLFEATFDSSFTMTKGEEYWIGWTCTTTGIKISALETLAVGGPNTNFSFYHDSVTEPTSLPTSSLVNSIGGPLVALS